MKYQPQNFTSYLFSCNVRELEWRNAATSEIYRNGGSPSLLNSSCTVRPVAIYPFPSLQPFPAVSVCSCLSLFHSILFWYTRPKYIPTQKLVLFRSASTTALINLCAASLIAPHPVTTCRLFLHFQKEANPPSRHIRLGRLSMSAVNAAQTRVETNAETMVVTIAV